MSRLYTEVRGNGPALLLLHGWGLNLRIWDGLAAALCDRFRIIAVDLPGHGRSAWLPERSSLEEQAAQVRETVAEIASEYSLLGWSLGSQIALQLAAGSAGSAEATRGAGAARSAESTRDAGATRRACTTAAIRRLVLIAATPRFIAAPDWPHGAPAERLAAQADGLRSDYRRTVSDFLELQVRGSSDGGETLEQLRAALFAHSAAAGAPRLPGPAAIRASGSRKDVHSDLRGLNIAALAHGLELLRDSDLRPLLAHITIPTLVIAGQYDRVIHPAASHALADALINARYVEIRRAAHAPFLSHLTQLSALISDFLLQP
ncbi:MAG TPA: alpha/beta fold hydrolase [Steroidobacteraceae bacterium]|nr:alpha/beta fold hydrolase [Steroidobacteraceae bacterium]